MPRSSLYLAAVASLLVACKSEPEPPPQPAKPDLAPEAAAINAELPDAMKGKLEFVAKELDDGDVFALVPKDWPESDVIPDKFAPAGAEIGSGVGLWTGTNCDGTCSPKDWKAVVEKVEFAGYNPPTYTVERDEPLGDNGRLVVYVGGDEVHIRAAWWKADAGRYLNCRADLDAAWAPAKDAFIRACKATLLRDWL